MYLILSSDNDKVGPNSIASVNETMRIDKIEDGQKQEATLHLSRIHGYSVYFGAKSTGQQL
jgi:hypothetical protein